MQRFIVYLTFIPWLLHFVEISKISLKSLKDMKHTKEWIKKNFFNVFRFDSLILFAIFIYFAINYHNANQIWLVEVLLFSSIYLYLYINSYYDKNKSKSKITTRDFSTILILLILIIIPVVYYASTKNNLNTYYILFIYTFFNFIIVGLSKFINELVLKIIKRKNNED